MSSSNRREIAKAASLVTIASLFLYAISFAREATIGLRYGIGVELDVLLFTHAIPLFIASTIASSIRAVIVPIYMDVHDPNQLQIFLNRLFSTLVIVLSLITLTLAIFSPWIITFFGGALTAQQSTLSSKLFWILLPIIPFLSISGFIEGIFFAEKSLILPSMFPALASLITAFCVFFGVKQWGIYNLAGGITLGAAIQAIFALGMLYRRGIHLRFTLSLLDPRLKRFFGLSFPLLIGAFSTNLTTVIDRSMAANLAAGSISSLGYASRINNLILLALGSLQTAVFPYFAEQASKGDIRRLMQDFSQTISLITFLLAPASVIVILFNRPLIALLFQRGNFDQTATALTGDALIGYAVGLVFMAAGMICVRLVHALQYNRLIGIQGALNPIWKITFNLLFIPILGHLGISLATSVMYTIGLVILLSGLGRYLRLRPTIQAAIPFIKIAIATGIMYLILLILRSVQPGFLMDYWTNILVMLLGSLAGLFIYIFTSYLLKIEEAHLMISFAQKYSKKLASKRVR